MSHDQPGDKPWEEDAATEQEIQELAQQLDSRSEAVEEAKASSGRDTSTLRRGFSSPATALILSLLALILTVLNILGVQPFGFRARQLGPEETTQHLEATLRFAKEEIQAFEEDNGRLPNSLAEVGLEGKADLKYEPLPRGAFRLTAAEADTTLEVTVPAAPAAVQGGPQ